MNEMCKLSIIVPCYGVEKFLPRCMESLMHQTLENIEIILVDDESPDRVPQMCDEYAKQDARIKVVHKKNGGLGFARNSGLEVATGEYVAFVDSDDFVELGMYKTLYEDAVKEQADVVFCNFQKETPEGTWNQCDEMAVRRVFTGKEIDGLMLDIVASAPCVPIDRKYQMSVWHAIYRRSIIEHNGIRFLSERDVASEDIPFDVDYLPKCKTIVYRPECFYHYCLNGNSLTAKYSPEKFFRYKTLYHYVKERMQAYGDDGIHRANRLFIGMIRTQVLHLARSDYKDKLSVLQRICADEIWKEIMANFKCSWLPKPASLLLWLTVHRQTRMLLLYAKLYNAMRGY